MPRTKVRIDVGELQDAINQLEAVRLFSSPHTLYVAIAETPWAQASGITEGMIYGCVREVNVDPDHPVITMRVKRARRVTPRRAKGTGATFPGVDVLVDVFRGRGIELTGAEWLMASSNKSDDENRAIRLAWADFRDRLGLPKPVKKSGAPVSYDLAEVVTPPLVAESVAITEESVEVTTEPVILTEEIPITEGLTVIEEMPDGQSVPQQEEVILDVTPTEQTVSFVPLSSPTMIPVRPVSSRPVPVRSSVPPRPMPATPFKVFGGKTQILNDDGTLKQP